MRKIDELHRDLKAVRHEVRSNIIEIVSEAKEMNVTEIQISYWKKHSTELEQSAVSFHLAILRSSNILHSRTVSKYRYYSLNISQLEKITTTIENY